jgi:ribonuclease HI
MSKNKVYAVCYSEGKTRFFDNWPDCQREVSGRSNIKYKGFKSMQDARLWISRLTGAAVDADDSGDLMVYVDGSYTPKCSRSGWGWVAVQGGKILAEDFGVSKSDAESRNIDGELEATLRAIEWLKTKKLKATIVHDYAGVSEWALGLWKAKSNIAQAYVNGIRQLNYRVAFQKVEGHSGDRWNDYADELAKKGIKKHISSLRN